MPLVKRRPPAAKAGPEPALDAPDAAERRAAALARAGDPAAAEPLLAALAAEPVREVCGALVTALAAIRTEAAEGISSLRGYLLKLRNDDTDGAEMQKLINALTVNETYFYREEFQLAALAAEIMPELAARRGGAPLRVWSLPCATTEEPYPIALRLLANRPGLATMDVEIMGSDIDTRVAGAALRDVAGRDPGGVEPRRLVADVAQCAASGRRASGCAGARVGARRRDDIRAATSGSGGRLARTRHMGTPDAAAHRRGLAGPGELAWLRHHGWTVAGHLEGGRLPGHGEPGAGRHGGHARDRRHLAAGACAGGGLPPRSRPARRRRAGGAEPGDLISSSSAACWTARRPRHRRSSHEARSAGRSGIAVCPRARATAVARRRPRRAS
jgi:hypothetical protein